MGQEFKTECKAGGAHPGTVLTDNKLKPDREAALKRADKAKTQQYPPAEAGGKEEHAEAR